MKKISSYTKKGLLSSIIATLPIIIGTILGIIHRNLSSEQGQIWGIFTLCLFILITIPFTVLTLYYGVKAVQIEKDKNPFISGMLLLLFFLVFIIISRVISPERGDLIFQVSLLIPVVILIFSTVKLISEHTVKKI